MDILEICIASFLGITFHIATFFLGLQEGVSINAPIIAASGPVFLYIFALLFLKERAHLVGFSMGSYAVLHFGLEYPERALSLVVVGGGYGSDPTWKDRARVEFERAADDFERLGTAVMAEKMSLGAARVQFQNSLGCLDGTIILTSKPVIEGNLIFC